MIPDVRNIHGKIVVEGVLHAEAPREDRVSLKFWSMALIAQLAGLGAIPFPHARDPAELLNTGCPAIHCIWAAASEGTPFVACRGSEPHCHWPPPV